MTVQRRRIYQGIPAEPVGPNYWGSGHCPRCGWTYELHPWDAEGVDAGRCPTLAEQEQLRHMWDWCMRGMMEMAGRFERAKAQSS